MKDIEHIADEYNAKVKFRRLLIKSGKYEGMTKQEEIDYARKVLKDNGYYVGNLWCIEDVQLNFDCTDKQAYKVLDKVLNNESVTEYIFDAIKIIANDLKLKNKE